MGSTIKLPEPAARATDQNVIYLEDYAREFNADGATDDRDALQALIERAEASANIDTVVFPSRSYKIDSSVSITKPIKLVGGAATKIVTDKIFDVFQSTSTNVRVYSIEHVPSARSAFFSQLADFDRIELAYCRQGHVADDQANYFFKGATGLDGGELNVYKNDLENTTPIFFDNDTEGKKLGTVRINANTSNNAPRYFARILGVNTDTPYVGNLYASQNVITNINGGMADPSAIVARVFQTGTTGTVNVTQNTVDGSVTGTNGNFIYMAGGSLNCHGNTVKNLQSIASSALIQDKKLREEGETWHIFENRFDLTGTAFANMGKAVIKVLNRQGAYIENNTFIGMKSYVLDVSQTQDGDPNPEKVTFRGNKVMDIDYPIVVNLQQQLSNISVADNDVFFMTNTTDANVNGTADCRLVSVYNTFNQVDGPKNITIENNRLHRCDRSVYIATLYINAAAPTSIIDRVLVKGNSFGEMTTPFNVSYVRFIGALQDNMTNVKITGNVSATAVTSQTVGVEPADLVKFNNMI